MTMPPIAQHQTIELFAGIGIVLVVTGAAVSVPIIAIVGVLVILIGGVSMLVRRLRTRRT